MNKKRAAKKAKNKLSSLTMGFTIFFITISIIILIISFFSVKQPSNYMQYAYSQPCAMNITFVSGNYLKANGTGFSYMGQRVCLYGVTIYASQGGTAPNYTWSDPQFTKRIDWDIQLAKQANLNILRPVDETNAATDDPYNPIVWQNMDYLVQQASANGMFVLMDLSTFRNHLRSQGINPYDPAQYPAWQQYINFVVSRYKNASNISNFKVAGEVNPPTSGTFPFTTSQGYIDFFNTTTTYIYQADGGNHLIVTGGLTHINKPSDGIPWQQIFSLPHSDIAVIHVYQSNRLDPINTSNDLHIAVPAVAQWAQQNSKPYEIEEYGFVQQVGDQARAADMQIIQQTAIQDGYQGLIQWNLGPKITGGMDFDVDQQTPLAWQQLGNGALTFYGSMNATVLPITPASPTPLISVSPILSPKPKPTLVCIGGSCLTLTLTSTPTGMDNDKDMVQDKNKDKEKTPGEGKQETNVKASIFQNLFQFIVHFFLGT